VVLEGKFSRDFQADLKRYGAALVPAKINSSPPWIFLAAESTEDLGRVPTIAKRMKGGAALWIVYPKGQKTITEAHVRGAGLKSGLTDVKVTRFSPTHTALKFVIPKSKR
jgi:hypothetical protein